MNSLVSKILACVSVVTMHLSISQGVIASELSDRIDRYPNWDTQAQISQHEGELTYPEWFRGSWIATSTLLEQIAPLAPEVVTPGFESNRQYINKPIRFTVQFVPKDLNKITQFPPLNLPKLKSNVTKSQIVADRAFNG